MFKKSISLLLTTTTISLGATALASQPPARQQVTQPSTKIVCSTETNPLSTVAYKQGENNMTPMFSWYPEYLLQGESAQDLCKQVAQTLQNKYDQGQKILLAYAEVNKNQAAQARWDVCLVMKPGDTCNSENSEKLFSLNYNYKEAPKCVMENTDPQDCPPNIKTRGSVISIPGGGYKPGWWFF